MALWLLITTFAHLLNAIVFIIDKHLVSKTVLRPIAYAFYSSIFQFVYLILIPFGFILPENNFIIICLFTGFLFTFILVVFYKAMQAAESTRVIPVIGALTPIFTFLLAYFVIGERLGPVQTIAFVFFIFGGFLLSFKFDHDRIKAIKGAGWAVLAAFLFALYFTLMKYIFLNLTFLSGFIVIQFGGFLGALILLMFKKNRESIFSSVKINKAEKKETLYLFIPDKLLGALAGFLIPFAISMKGSSVTIINSLQAVQYVFLLIFAVILSKKFPSFLKEQVGKKVIKRKIAAIVLIALGLLILSRV